jgi:hypothetical protein
MAPPGTKIVAHENSQTRPSFSVHGKIGWYIGPALEHYRCWKCYFPDTMQERNVLKVDFFPEKIVFPTFTREAYLRQTAEDMLHLLQPQDESPIQRPLEFGPPILNAFVKVAKILGRAVQSPQPRAPDIVTETTEPHSPPLATSPREQPSIASDPPAVTPPRVPVDQPSSEPRAHRLPGHHRSPGSGTSSEGAHFQASVQRDSSSHPINNASSRQSQIQDNLPSSQYRNFSSSRAVHQA